MSHSGFPGALGCAGRWGGGEDEEGERQQLQSGSGPLWQGTGVRPHFLLFAGFSQQGLLLDLGFGDGQRSWDSGDMGL